MNSHKCLPPLGVRGRENLGVLDGVIPSTLFNSFVGCCVVSEPSPLSSPPSFKLSLTIDAGN